MPSIGELFVTLGAKTDASLTEALKKLQGLGVAAKQSTQMINAAARQSLGGWGALSREISGVSNEFKNVGNAAKATSREVANAAKAARQSLESLRVSNLAARSAGRGGGGINWGAVGDPFNPQSQKNAIRELQNSLGPKINKARSAGNDAMEEMWASLSGQPRGTSQVPLLQKNGGWASFMAGAPQDNRQYVAEGMPFAGGGGRKGGGRPGGSGGRKGGGGGGGFGNRPYGPLGEASQLRRVILGAGLFQGVQYLTGIADSFTVINNRLRQVSTSEEDVNKRFDRLRDIALRTRSALDTTAEAYVRIKMATSSLKLSEDQQYKLIERINMAFKLSGATTSEASSGMIQLTQAFNKGKLDGDEFRTMAEEMPNVLDSLAKVLHKPKEQLFALSKQGKLTRDVLVKAFLDNNDIEKGFAKTKATFAEQWEGFKTQITKPIGDALNNPEVQKAVSEIFDNLAKLLILIVPILASVVKYIAQFIKGLADGKPWAIGLAVALGTMLIPQLIAMAFWLARMAAMPFTAIIGQIGKIKSLMGGDFAGAGINTSVLGGGGAGGVAGKGGGGVGGASSSVANGVGTIPLIGQAVAAGLAMREGTKYAGDKLGFNTGKNSLFTAITGTGNENILDLFGGGGGGGNSWLWNQASSMNKNSPEAKNLQNLKDSQRVNGLNQVNVGPTTVTIYAKDGKDAADQFTQEMVDKIMRHAAASVNRPGS